MSAITTIKERVKQFIPKSLLASYDICIDKIRLSIPEDFRYEVWRIFGSTEKAIQIRSKGMKISDPYVRKLINNEKVHSDNYEKKQSKDYLLHNGSSFFTSDLWKKYFYRKIKVSIDRKLQLQYVITDEHRQLYFHEKSNAKVARVYNQLCAEQDVLSPHAYEDQKIYVEQGGIALDVGGAEGIWGLKNVDKVKHLFIFECDDRWEEPLQATFAAYSDKVTIIRKYVGVVDSENEITLENFMKEYEIDKIDFLKMDIEGAEVEVLESISKLLEKGKIRKMAICAYHRAQDETKIRKILGEYSYEVYASNGYCYFPADTTNESPILRRGVIRAKYVENDNSDKKE